ncbi:YhcN/YlaJ family sporulation lipoprotein [Paenibacillus agilis]|nr:YhcN/YlaJ family sporulation lipoprotein [Paenibacillus agilis]
MRMKTALLTLTAAIVMMTGLTGCYNNGTTTKGAHPNTTHNYSNGMAPYGTPSTNGYGYPNGYGTPYSTDGRYSHHYNRDGMSGYGYNGYSNNYNNGYSNGYRGYGTNRMHSGRNATMSQKAADKVASIPGVHRAYVVESNNNAYVAVTTTSMHGKGGVNKANTGNHQTLSQDMKTKIAKAVKQVSPNCQNVYVSENPDFVNRMSQYSNHVRAGHPFEGFAVEFNEMTRRVFPTNAGHAVK